MIDKQQYKLLKLLSTSIQEPIITDEEVLVWVSFSDLDEFRTLIAEFFDSIDEWMDVTLLAGGISFDGTEMFRFYRINTDIFPRDGD